MTGLELYNKYTSKRDYSNSSADTYAQELLTMFSEIGEAIFPLLEEAEKEGKRLSLVENQEPPHDQYTTDNIILV